jgi:hypothetical protein
VLVNYRPRWISKRSPATDPRAHSDAQVGTMRHLPTP